MKPKTVKAPKVTPRALLRKKIIARKLAPWNRPKVVLPYTPTLFTVEQITAAIEEVVAA